MSKISVQRTKDLKAVERLNRLIFSKDEPDIQIDRTTWWMATLDGNPVGFAGLRPLPHEPYTYFTLAGVVKSARGRGIHKRLIKVRLNHSRREGYRGAMTYTLYDNFASANNLITMGFRLFEPSWKWAGGDCLYFCLDFAVKDRRAGRA